jgi:hypothetical protein
MNLTTLQNNLRNTIAGKEHMLDSHKRYLRGQGITVAETIASETVVKFLEVNIDELKRILTDVELCINDAAARSWDGCVDRMSGAFDDDELRGRDGWN